MTQYIVKHAYVNTIGTIKLRVLLKQHVSPKLAFRYREQISYKGPKASQWSQLSLIWSKVAKLNSKFYISNSKQIV